jgi:hypothetical protein
VTLEGRSSLVNLKTALQSQSLTTLNLGHRPKWIEFPSTLPTLQVLSLRGEMDFKILEHFSAPNLQTLEYLLYPAVRSISLTECPGSISVN